MHLKRNRVQEPRQTPAPPATTALQILTAPLSHGVTPLQAAGDYIITYLHISVAV